MKTGINNSHQNIVVSAGDSLTNGTFSSNYLSMLQNKLKGQHYEFFNAGQNGDTSATLLKRLDKDVLSRNPSFITVLIGANDVRQETELTQALDAYKRNIGAIINKIRTKTNAPVALISLAPLGENPNSKKNSEVERFNLILKDIASKQNLGYLLLFEKLKPILLGKVPRDFTAFKLNLGSALIKSGFKKYILRRSWDEISAGNGFSVLTDGIHINDKGGNIVSDLIEEWILGINQS